jgi:hypothetical protein
MKKMTTIIMAMALCLTAAPAFAVDTTKVYNSGILVILFLGVCALIVLVQLMPALVMLAGSIKSMIRGGARSNATPVPIKK